MFFHLGLFFCLGASVTLKGRSLRCSPGRGKAGRSAVTLYMGEGPRGSNDTCSTLHHFAVTPSATHNQIGPLWCWFSSGWACACSRPLGSLQSPLLWGWEFLPLLPQTLQLFSIRSLRFYFPLLEPWVAQYALLPAARLTLSMCKCGAAGCYPPLCLPRCLLL